MYSQLRTINFITVLKNYIVICRFFSDYFKDRKGEKKIDVNHVNEVIQDISGRDSNTLNIIMIDELILDELILDDTNLRDGENLFKSDWSNLDVSKPNIFLLMAFNPSGLINQSNQNAKFQIQTPGYDITNIQEDIKETIEKLSDKTENKNTLHHQLQVGYRSVESIADLANYYINHKHNDGKYLE